MSGRPKRDPEMVRIFRARFLAMQGERPERAVDLARALGVTTTAISNWSCGVRFPNILSLIRIARHYDVSVDWLIGLTDERRTLNGESF